MMVAASTSKSTKIPALRPLPLASPGATPTSCMPFMLERTLSRKGQKFLDFNKCFYIQAINDSFKDNIYYFENERFTMKKA